VEAAAIGERIREIVGRAADEYGVELVHAEVAGTGRQTTVRIFIDKPGGVTHADCSNMSRHVGTVLDVEDFINSAYTLEVSSPASSAACTSAVTMNASPAVSRN